MFSRHSARRLSFEPLDPRLPLAGNVLADLVSGNLVLQGDGQANQISISPVVVNGEPQPGTFVVRGLEVDGSAPTTINGRTSVLVRFVTGSVSVNLNGGDDVLIFGSQYYSNIDRDLTIITSDGNDTVALYNTVTQGLLSIDTGAGDDQIVASDVTVLASGIVDEFLIRTGAGSDILDLRNVATLDDMRIDTGSDDARDSVMLVDAVIGDDLRIFTGGGHDGVAVDRLVAADLLIDTGDGRDIVVVESTVVDRLFAQLGAGDNDWLYLRNFSARYASIRGGAGNGDRVDLWDNVRIRLLDEDEFEVIVT